MIEDKTTQSKHRQTARQPARPAIATTKPKPGATTPKLAVRSEACAEPHDCARGLYCALNVCHKLRCGADYTACDEGESCIRALEVRAGGEVIPADAYLCFPVDTCDPLDPSSCAEPAFAHTLGR